MTERETLDLYEATGALLRGHFRLTSGLHSDVYLQSALVLQHPAHAAALGAALAAPFRGERRHGRCWRPRSAASWSLTRSRARSACARSSPSARTA